MFSWSGESTSTCLGESNVTVADLGLELVVRSSFFCYLLSESPADMSKARFGFKRMLCSNLDSTGLKECQEEPMSMESG